MLRNICPLKICSRSNHAFRHVNTHEKICLKNRKKLDDIFIISGYFALSFDFQIWNRNMLIRFKWSGAWYGSFFSNIMTHFYLFLYVFDCTFKEWSSLLSVELESLKKKIVKIRSFVGQSTLFYMSKLDGSIY